MTTNRSGITFKTITLGTGGLLLIPLLARWPWTVSDYIIMGILLLSTGLALDLTLKKVSKEYRLFAAVVVLATFFLIWAQLAVGLVEKILRIF